MACFGRGDNLPTGTPELRVFRFLDLAFGRFRRYPSWRAIGGTERCLQSLQSTQRLRDSLSLFVVGFEFEQLIQASHGDVFDFPDSVGKLMKVYLYETRVRQ